MTDPIIPSTARTRGNSWFRVTIGHWLLRTSLVFLALALYCIFSKHRGALLPWFIGLAVISLLGIWGGFRLKRVPIVLDPATGQAPKRYL